jgi:hypothetical protein
LDPVRGIVIQGESRKGFLLQAVRHIGAAVQEIDLHLTEAGAFLIAYVAGIPANGTHIPGLQRIRTKPMDLQKHLPFMGKIPDRLVDIHISAAGIAQQEKGFAHGGRSDLLIDLRQPGDLFIDRSAPLIQLPLAFRLAVLVYSHDGIILCVGEQGLLLIYI